MKLLLHIDQTTVILKFDVRNSPAYLDAVIFVVISNIVAIQRLYEGLRRNLLSKMPENSEKSQAADLKRARRERVSTSCIDDLKA